MKKQYILAIDEGTTGVTALVIDRGGVICGRGYAEIDQHYPQPGWVEQDPDDIWRKTLRVMQEAQGKAGVDDSQIAAIGITNQRETTILIDKETGDAIGPAIVWQCRRTASRCDELRANGLEETI